MRKTLLAAALVAALTTPALGQECKNFAASAAMVHMVKARCSAHMERTPYGEKLLTELMMRASTPDDKCTTEGYLIADRAVATVAKEMARLAKGKVTRAVECGALAAILQQTNPPEPIFTFK